MTIDIAATLLDSTKKVTKAHTKQVKREERSASAKFYRSSAYASRESKKEILFQVLPKAYSKASDDGRLPAAQRQIYYAARDLWLQQDPDMELAYNSFTSYLAEYLFDSGDDWRVVKDARGKLIEPHTKESVPLGTIEVDSYLDNSFGRQAERLADEVEITLDYPTAGPTNRFSALIYLEKEGFNAILEDAGIPQKYDAAIASSKGQSVIAMRKLVDEFCGPGGIPLLIVHDFDQAGFSIAETLVSSSMRYTFENDVKFIDLGLRLADVRKYGLTSEPCNVRGQRIGGDATAEEREFLLNGERVELNAMTSPQFVEWIESNLQKHKIKKVIPEKETLDNAYRRAFVRGNLQRQIEESSEQLTEEAENLKIPKNLRAQISKRLKAEPHEPWDRVILEIVRDDHDEL